MGEISTGWMFLIMFLLTVVTIGYWVFKNSAFVQTATDEAKKEYREAEDEILRITKEKGWGKIQRMRYAAKALWQAKQCTGRYIDAAKAGGKNIPCTCGLHPSRGGNFTNMPSP